MPGGQLPPPAPGPWQVPGDRDDDRGAGPRCGAAGRCGRQARPHRARPAPAGPLPRGAARHTRSRRRDVGAAGGAARRGRPVGRARCRDRGHACRLRQLRLRPTRHGGRVRPHAGRGGGGAATCVRRSSSAVTRYAGFWFGDKNIPEPAFYSYTRPSRPSAGQVERPPRTFARMG
ncbi:DUF5996 family protein [Micromonospora sp. NPDC002717]|uniref:DUF5996 family protein n=1 Tax=Micromonospora sp. NPDC002717 TaxID=3154424 RepID=UPI003329A1F5